jgi:hypothetical protein
MKKAAVPSILIAVVLLAVAAIAQAQQPKKVGESSSSQHLLRKTRNCPSAKLLAKPSRKKANWFFGS